MCKSSSIQKLDVTLQKMVDSDRVKIEQNYYCKNKMYIHHLEELKKRNDPY